MADSGRHAVRSGRLSPAVIVTAAIVGGSALIGAGVVSALTVMVSRIVITPPRRRREPVAVLAVDRAGGTVTFDRVADSDLPGRYGFWFDRDSGHARIGGIVDRTALTVTRELIGVDFGDLDRAGQGRFSGWFHLDPTGLGLPWESIALDTELGEAPAWVVPDAAGSDRWVVQVHGRGVTRSETLRAVPVFHSAGYNSLLVSWRNDGEAPPSADGRYALGGSEWRDVEAGIRFALDRGAGEIVLMGWSMGGAVVLQTLLRSELAGVVTGLVLESPVVDWAPTLDFQASQMRIPGPVRHAALRLLASRRARLVTGLGEPIDFRVLDLVSRADEIKVPVLLLHSADDGFVPPTASRALAAARLDNVTFHEWTEARHARLWNFDSDEFDGQIAEWLRRLPSREAAAWCAPASPSSPEDAAG